jgi:hypothetical protein
MAFFVLTNCALQLFRSIMLSNKLTTTTSFGGSLTLLTLVDLTSLNESNFITSSNSNFGALSLSAMGFELSETRNGLLGPTFLSRLQCPLESFALYSYNGAFLVISY